MNQLCIIFLLVVGVWDVAMGFGLNHLKIPNIILALDGASVVDETRALHLSFPAAAASIINFDDGGFLVDRSLGDDGINLWTIRIGSALATYFGFVAVTDRPKGQLGLPLTTENGQEGCLKVQTSLVPGAGLGLFVTRSLPKGTVLGTYPGVVLPLQQHSQSSKIKEYSECLTYIWRFTDNRFVIDPTDHATGELMDYCVGGNPGQPLSVGFWKLANGLGFTPKVSTALCRINEPPIGKDVNVITEENLQTRTVTFVLERDVYEGEELHIDYGLTYDRSGYSG